MPKVVTEPRAAALALGSGGGPRTLMVKIRLRRVGAKKAPSYRIVVADSRSPRDGAFVEIIGTYNPFPNPPAIELNEERARYWLKSGAQPSDAVAHMLRVRNLIPAGTTHGRPAGTTSDPAPSIPKP